MEYSEYRHLTFKQHDDGVLLVTLNRPEVLNATNARMHWELSRVWKDIDDDPQSQGGARHRRGAGVFGRRR